MRVETRGVQQSHPRWLEIQELRRKHGFRPRGLKARAGRWSRDQLTKMGGNRIPVQSDTWPKNRPIYEYIAERFPGFSWNAVEREVKGQMRRWVEFHNVPTVGGVMTTLADLCLIPVELTDGFEERKKMFGLPIGRPVNFDQQIQIMNATGIGYKGFSGVSWRSAYQPFVLPIEFEERTQSLAEALFLFFDAVGSLYGSDQQLTAMLQHKVPPHILQLVAGGEVGIIRPDVVVAQDEDGTMRPVITELESAPAGQGMTYALQLGYGLPTTMIDKFVRYLDGRPFRVFGTHEWSEYAWEQGCFIQALCARGVDAELWFDASLERIASLARSWNKPKGMPEHMERNWNTDFIGRLQANGFDQFVRGFELGKLPEDVGEAVVFRFGYFDNLSQAVIERLLQWQTRGAVIHNPLWFFLESKVLMAAAWLPGVVDWIKSRKPEAVKVLQSCLAETCLLASGYTWMHEIVSNQSYWLTKFAAWDGNNQSWGARSLKVGSQVNTSSQWRLHLNGQQSLSHPVVAQHLINSARFDVPYVGEDSRLNLQIGARTRLTPFFLRMPDGSIVQAGSTMTLRAKTFRIHGATDAVEAPVVFRNET